MINKVADSVHNLFPAFNSSTGLYELPFAMVRLSGRLRGTDVDTQIFNSDLPLDTQVGSERDAIRTLIASTVGQSYAFEDADGGLVTQPRLDETRILTNSTLDFLLREIYNHLQHSSLREKPSPPSLHNTEFSDDFSTDPSSRWTQESAGFTFTWDSVNGEVEPTGATGNEYNFRYNSSLGSIDCESQGTLISYTANGSGWSGPACIRNRSGADTTYHLEFEPGAGANGTLYLIRGVAGTYNEVTNFSLDIDTNTFYTARIAAEGAAGANVDIDIWTQNHGASKPSDPGWIGVDGSPDLQATDTDASRIDDSDATFGGIGGWAEAYDERIDFWKGRAVSDRGAGASLGQHPISNIRHHLTR